MAAATEEAREERVAAPAEVLAEEMAADLPSLAA